MFVDATEHKFDGHYFAPYKFQYPLGIFYLYIYVYLITVLFIYFFFFGFNRHELKPILHSCRSLVCV